MPISGVWVRQVVPVLFAMISVGGCIPQFREAGLRVQTPQLGEFFVAGDGEKLSYEFWLPDNPGKNKPPRAVIAAVHGFNEYSKVFSQAARYWEDRGIATYAYDQRGFGGNYPRGVWPGKDALVDDVKDFVSTLRARHPDVPLYLLGSSMGGAVIIAALGGPEPPPVDGAIVVAPAAYGRAVLPHLYSGLLWIAAHTVPWAQVTGRDLERVPSDNKAMLRALALDVRVIKGARFDALYGLVNLMDLAFEAAPTVRVPLLFLYGEKDDIIRPPGALLLLNRLPDDARRVGIYKDGYHMLLRDLQAQVVHADIAAWILNRARPLPSGADNRGTGHLLKNSGL